MARGRGPHRGQSTVEFGLSSVILLLILLGLIDLGRAFYFAVGMQSATREGARPFGPLSRELSSPRRAAGTAGGKSYKMQGSVEYHITQYELEQGALEIQYMEEYFGEFPRKKTATASGRFCRTWAWNPSRWVRT